MHAIPRRLLLVLSLFAVTPAHADWLHREEAIMGTRIYVELWDDNRIHGEAAIDAVMENMHRIDELMSHYKPESQLSQINMHAAVEPVRVDRELFDLIRTSIHFSQITEGAFDITYASVGYLYDYPRHVHPSDAEIKAALPGVNYRNLVLDADHDTVKFAREGMRIDLGGIAKGYACDQGVEILKRFGVEHAMVMAGGDTRLLGDRRGRPWMVGIRHPDNKNKVVLSMPLADVGISTSGDYERYFDEGGVRYHHIIDPKTGRSPTGVRSVTIIGPTATDTEGWSKGVFIKGPVEGIRLIEQYPQMDAVVVDRAGKVWYSKGLAPPSH
ncbi:MAG: FAD:protein FMN transferase [Proteobacteria bacterium]|nr:FAD:protein FMN transferase [Pseudomonadota bacterium]